MDVNTWTSSFVLVIAFCLLSVINCDVTFNTTSISSPRNGMSLIEARSNLYFVGGFEFHDNVATNKIEVFDLINRTWSTPLQLPSRRAYVTPVVQETYLYFVGGYEQSNPPYVYDQNMQAFSTDHGQGPSVLQPKGLYLHESILTVVGTYSVDFLDLTTNKWNYSTDLTAITMNVFDSIIFSHEDIVVVIGGTNVTTNEEINSAWIYNRTSDSLLTFTNAIDASPPFSDYQFNVTNGIIAVWFSNVTLLHRLGDPDWHQLTIAMEQINAIISTPETTFIFNLGTYLPFFWSNTSVGDYTTLADFRYSFFVDGYVAYLESGRFGPIIHYWNDASGAWSLWRYVYGATTFNGVRLSATVGEWACLATKFQILAVNIRQNNYTIQSNFTEISSLLAGNNTCHFIDEFTPRRYHFNFDQLPAVIIADEIVTQRFDPVVAIVGNFFFTAIGGVFRNDMLYDSYNRSGELKLATLWASNSRHFVMAAVPSTQYYDQVDIYDLDTQKWLNSTTMPFDAYSYTSHMPATGLGDKLIVWNFGSMGVYDPLIGNWTYNDNGTVDAFYEGESIVNVHIPVLTINDTAYLRTNEGRFAKYQAASPFDWSETKAVPLQMFTYFAQYLDIGNNQVFISSRDSDGRSSIRFSTIYLYDTVLDSFQTSLIPNITGRDLTIVPVGGFVICFSVSLSQIFYYEVSSGQWYDQPYVSGVLASAVYRTSVGLSFVVGGMDTSRRSIYSAALLTFEADAVTVPPASPMARNETFGTPGGLSEGELIAAIVVPVGAALIAGALLLILLLRKKRKQKGGNVVSMAGLASKYGQWFIPFDQIKFGDQLGRGASGQVFKGSWKGSPVALKVSMTQANKTVISELELMIQMRPHPNVVQLFGFSVHPETDSIILVIEYCDGGSLDDVLFDTNQQIPMEQKIAFVLGIAKGLSHLHSNNIVHRDVAARNVLLHKNEPKLTDFGMSRLIEDDTQRGTTKSELGPIRWMSPESLKNKEYSAKSDVWSFGIVMYEVIAQQEPHLSADPIEIGRLIRDNGVTPDIPEHCPNKIASIMRSCWEMNPIKRPSIEQIMDQLEGIDLT